MSETSDSSGYLMIGTKLLSAQPPAHPNTAIALAASLPGAMTPQKLSRGLPFIAAAVAAGFS